jgi:NAD(P)-dependent dehydrogenase (short-subunit alcohol dehydrogenase family)
MAELGFVNAPANVFRAASRAARLSPRRAFHMASNTGKTAVITGASGGIGAETALRLRKSMPDLERLVLCARNTEKASGGGLDTRVVPLELGSLDSVRKCADDVARELGGSPLDLLINNAGVMACPLGFTSDGIEMQYGVNHIGAAALTLALLPKVQVANNPRIIFVSSMALQLARGLESPPLLREKLVENLQADKYARWQAYGESKLAMSMFAKALAMKNPDVVSVSLHPGVVMTDLGRHITPAALTRVTESSSVLRTVVRGAMSLFGLLTPEEGAQMTLDVAGALKDDLRNGTFYRTRILKPYIIPMLSNDQQCSAVFEDTVTYLESKQFVYQTSSELVR